jgi:hypothetical protein
MPVAPHTGWGVKITQRTTCMSNPTTTTHPHTTIMRGRTTLDLVGGGYPNVVIEPRPPPTHHNMRVLCQQLKRERGGSGTYTAVRGLWMDRMGVVCVCVSVCACVCVCVCGGQIVERLDARDISKHAVCERGGGTALLPLTPLYSLRTNCE